MTQKTFMEQCRASLNDVISEWITEQTSADGGEHLGWVPDGLSRLMTSAAMAVLEMNANTQEWLESENMMKKER